MRRSALLMLVAALACSSIAAQADEPQSLSAHVDAMPFAGDDDTILFVPMNSGTFSLIAATAGAASYPPPKTPIDRLSINCTGFHPGKTLTLVKNEFSAASCNATFTLGTNDEQFTLDKDSEANRFEITATHAKVIEGRFQLHLTNKAGKSMTISDGRFVAEDRQM